MAEGKLPPTEEFDKALTAGAETFGVRLTAEARAGLRDYFELVGRWNARLHLVAPCEPAEFATRHVLESLLALPYLPEGASFVDVGSGAKERGLASSGVGGPLVVYASDQCHYSFTKGVDIVGIGRENLRKVESDGRFHIRIDLLREAIRRDLEEGKRPACVVELCEQVNDAGEAVGLRERNTFRLRADFRPLKGGVDVRQFYIARHNLELSVLDEFD